MVKTKPSPQRKQYGTRSVPDPMVVFINTKKTPHQLNCFGGGLSVISELED